MSQVPICQCSPHPTISIYHSQYLYLHWILSVMPILTILCYSSSWIIQRPSSPSDATHTYIMKFCQLLQHLYLCMPSYFLHCLYCNSFGNFDYSLPNIRPSRCYLQGSQLIFCTSNLSQYSICIFVFHGYQWNPPTGSVVLLHQSFNDALNALSPSLKDQPGDTRGTCTEDSFLRDLVPTVDRL